MRTLGVLLLLALTLPQSKKPVPPTVGGGWCCLCMCNSKDQDKCAHYCIRKQHGKEIVDEKEMNVCTMLCIAKFRQRGGVPQ